MDLTLILTLTQVKQQFLLSFWKLEQSKGEKNFKQALGKLQATIYWLGK